MNEHCLTNRDFYRLSYLGAKLSIQYLLPALISDIMQKIPLDGVSGAARAARRAGAHSTQTACHVIHSSFCCAPGESVTAPAQSITMQTKAHRHVRGATQLARNAKVSVSLSLCTSEWKKEVLPQAQPSPFLPSEVPLACQPPSPSSPTSAPSALSQLLQLPSNPGCSCPTLLPLYTSHPSGSRSSPPGSVPPALSSFSSC